jgi:serine/threonine protein kinase
MTDPSATWSNAGSLELPKRFQLLACVGTTRSGGVFRCRDAELDRDVAIKLYLRGLRSTDVAASMQREREAHEQLTADAIPRLLDSGVTPSGDAYHAFPFATGGSGAERRGDRPEAARRALRDALAALDAAHRSGWVHADLAPSNLLETEDGSWWLGDWGSSHPLGDSAIADSRRLGTPGLMSPEQMRGEAVTPQSDLFSLAMSIAWLHTGSGLLAGQSVSDLAPIFGDLRPLASRRLQGMAEAEREWLIACLHPDPGQRPESASAFHGESDPGIPSARGERPETR